MNVVSKLIGEDPLRYLYARDSFAKKMPTSMNLKERASPKRNSSRSKSPRKSHESDSTTHSSKEPASTHRTAADILHSLKGIITLVVPQTIESFNDFNGVDDQGVDDRINASTKVVSDHKLFKLTPGLLRLMFVLGVNSASPINQLVVPKLTNVELTPIWREAMSSIVDSHFSLNPGSKRQHPELISEYDISFELLSLVNSSKFINILLKNQRRMMIFNPPQEPGSNKSHHGCQTLHSNVTSGRSKKHLYLNGEDDIKPSSSGMSSMYNSDSPTSLVGHNRAHDRLRQQHVRLASSMIVVILIGIGIAKFLTITPHQ